VLAPPSIWTVLSGVGLSFEDQEVRRRRRRTVWG
jgi:hypothetical protein